MIFKLTWASGRPKLNWVPGIPLGSKKVVDVILTTSRLKSQQTGCGGGGGEGAAAAAAAI